MSTNAVARRTRIFCWGSGCWVSYRRRALAARTVLFTILTTLTLWPLASAALPDDRAQPIRISADSASRDDRAGVTRYQGNVELQQGSLKINADLISIHHDEKQTDLIIAEGVPATMTQTPEVGKGPIRASANRIEYRRSDDLVRLITEANIEQDGATVSGDTIDYLVTEQRVVASAGDDNGRRVEVVIPPEAFNETD